jgi:uncharacterized protein YciI
MYYMVNEGRGPSWDPSRPRRQQAGWDEHAEFMDALAAEGFVVLGGPVGDGVRVMLVVDAESEAEIRRRLVEDPWLPAGILTLESVEPWEVLLRAPR